ncbi:MAG TPA: hypothetical protein EYQ08_02655 [Planctomycetes bacterium]|nr:hypothetical protein [Planctomycetota bacterium]
MIVSQKSTPTISSLVSPESRLPLLGWMLLLTCTCGCSISEKFQQRLEVTATLSAARTAPDGKLTTTVNDTTSSQVHLEQQDLSESSLSAGMRIQFDHGPLRFLVDNIGASSASTGFFSGALVGKDLPAGIYGSEIELSSARLLMAFPLSASARGEEGTLDARLLAGLDLTGIRLQFKSTSDPAEFAEFDELVPAPVLGIQSSIRIAPAWDIEGIFTFLPLAKITDYDADCIDGSIRLGWDPDPDWNLFAGVRSHNIKLSRVADGRPIDLDFSIEVIELGVEYQF